MSTEYTLTDDDAFALRRAAHILRKLDERMVASSIDLLVEGETEVRELCEAFDACGALATTADSEGVPLCEKCMASLVAHQHPETV
jgi:hypothetical protein